MGLFEDIILHPSFLWNAKASLKSHNFGTIYGEWTYPSFTDAPDNIAEMDRPNLPKKEIVS
jgi:hypothetical protein